MLNRFAFGPESSDLKAVQELGLSKWMEAQLTAQDTPEELRELIPAYYVSNSEVVKKYPRMGDLLKEAGAAGRMSLKGVKFDKKTKRRLRKYAAKNGYGRQSELYKALVASRVYRAVYSKHQVREVMVEFWFNHFSLPASNNRCRPFVLSYEREAIRPNSLGPFREILGAASQHPAMLLYLENATSTAAPQRKVQGHSDTAKNVRLWSPGGVNENHARELLELHTLGSDSGYTQEDVENTARILTGWTCKPLNRQHLRLFELELSNLQILRFASNPRVRWVLPLTSRVIQILSENTGSLWRTYLGGISLSPTPEQARANFERTFDPFLALAPVPTSCPYLCLSELDTAEAMITKEFFVFFPFVHDVERKTVLGKDFPAGRGLEEGEELLDFLSQHPATAQRIATKFAQNFCSDDPDQKLVEDLALAFRNSGGETGALIRTLLESETFWKAARQREKVKSPLTLLASALRALNGNIDLKKLNLHAWSKSMGQPFFSCPSPEGYPSSARESLNVSTTFVRMNFGSQLLNQKMPGISVDLGTEGDLQQRKKPEDLLDGCREKLFINLSSIEKRVLARALEQTSTQSRGKDHALRSTLELLLSSPEFQRR